MRNDFLKRLNKKLTYARLIKIIFVLLIFYLLKQTESVWGEALRLALTILQPFLIGFALAYLIDPFVSWLKRKKVPTSVSVPCIWLVLITCLLLLFMGLLPLVYDKIVNFISSLTMGLQEISEKIVSWINPDEELSLLSDLSAYAIDLLKTYDTWLPDLVNSIPSYMNTFWNYLTGALFSIIIAIYMQFHFDAIKANIYMLCERLCKGSGCYLKVIDEDLTIYLKSLVIIMAIKLAEYSLFYLLIGHQDWLIIAILMSIGVMIPYLGGTIANMVGILTALTLPTGRIVMLLVGIVVLSNLDAYVISPLVHEKRSDLGPLVTLLAVFAGGCIAGAIGIMLSVPAALAIRSVYQLYNKQHTNDEILKEEL